jgi:hypothetical protein
MKSLKLNFTNVSEEFIQLSVKMAIEQGFSKERFKHACKALLLSHVYPTIQIANLLSHDVKISLYTHEDKLKALNEMGVPFDSWVMWGEQENGKPYWAKKKDLDSLNIAY